MAGYQFLFFCTTIPSLLDMGLLYWIWGYGKKLLLASSKKLLAQKTIEVGTYLFLKNLAKLELNKEVHPRLRDNLSLIVSISNRLYDIILIFQMVLYIHIQKRFLFGKNYFFYTVHLVFEME